MLLTLSLTQVVAQPSPYPNLNPPAQDQIHHLKEGGIEAVSFTSNADWGETRAIMDSIRSNTSNVKVRG